MKNRIFLCFLTLVFTLQSVSQNNSVQFCLKYYIFDRYPDKIYNFEDVNNKLYVQDNRCNNDTHLSTDNYKWYIDTINVKPIDNPDGRSF